MDLSLVSVCCTFIMCFRLNAVFMSMLSRSWYNVSIVIGLFGIEEILKCSALCSVTLALGEWDTLKASASIPILILRSVYNGADA